MTAILPLTFDDHLFLVDCSEGTQMQLARYKMRRSRISHIHFGFARRSLFRTDRTS
ncbi:MAG: hypothetical protein WCF67_01095 [Chitinophagaceae bacterium]